MNITLDEFKARYFSPEERARREAERIKAEKERVRKVKDAENDYWQMYCDHVHQYRRRNA